MVSETSLVSTYRYRHGYYDGVEREFRGFAMVEQADAEVIPGAEHALPPVRTRSWYHTGAYVDGADLTTALAAEFWAGDAAAPQLAGPDLADEITPAQVREALRALRRRALRTEIYADDASPQAGIPYSVASHRHAVQLLQPPSQTSHARACTSSTSKA